MADGARDVDVLGGTGVQVGDFNTQIFYTYNGLTWTDKVAPPPLASVSGAIDSPYRGLGAFDERDAAFFFGREEAAAQLLQRMSKLIDGSGLLMVSGASGAGKSSLLRAGVLPRIRGAGLASAPGAASWPCLVFTPGRSPLDELALRAGLLAGADAAAVRRGLRDDPAGFALTARQAALAGAPAADWEPAGPGAPPSAAERRLLLVVDQFEQLFTQCSDEQERRAFCTALFAATRYEPGRAPAALVVLGVRADFEARCADYPQLAAATQDRYLVMAMTPRQLRLAITEPAKTAGSRVDDDLAEVLLAEVQARQDSAGAGMLPLLSHALDLAWRSRAGQTLALADYERTGGIQQAVADSAQRAYDRLTAGQRAEARRVFLRLTATSPDGTDTADRATRNELTEGKGAAAAADVEAVLDAFAAERLLTLAADSVEVSHEALLTAWPLLRDTWLAGTHADRITRTRLRTAAAEWARRSRDPSYLYRGTLLADAIETAARNSADRARSQPLSQAERDFLGASDRLRRRAARWRRTATASLLAVTLAAIATAGVAVRNAADATSQHAIALSRQLAAESLTADADNYRIARQLAVAAWSVAQTSQAASAMTALLAEQQQDGMLPAAPPGGAFGVAFSRDGKLLATVDGADGTAQLWNPATGQAVGRPILADQGVGAVAFSPDGRLLATAGNDGRVRFWDWATGKVARSPLVAAGPGLLDAVAFSPDGKLLATGGDGGRVRFWDYATGKAANTTLPAIGPVGPDGIAFSPDGKLLATAADGRARLWNTATGKPAPASRTLAGRAVNAVTFTADGLLATAEADSTVRRWDPATGRPDGVPFTIDPGLVLNDAAFSPDGMLLATADGDGTVRLWSIATGKPAGATVPGGADAIAFSPDGRLLATADGDGAARLWNPATRQLAATLVSAATGPVDVTGVAFSPDGKLLAAAGADGAVQLWRTATRKSIGTLLADPGPRGGVDALAFTADSRLLATGDADGRVRLWNTATRAPAGTLVPPDDASTIDGVDVGVHAVAFSRDGKLMATAADADDTVQLWRTATWEPIGTPVSAGTTGLAPDGGVAFSPDSQLLAIADEDGPVQLLSTTTRKLIGTLPADPFPDGTLNAIAFSPDGELLATADFGGKVRLWNTVARAPAGAPLPADGGTSAVAVTGVAFSLDGKLLASVDSDGRAATVQLWDMPLFANPYAALCSDVGPPAQRDWDSYAPGEPFPSVCR